MAMKLKVEDDSAVLNCQVFFVVAFAVRSLKMPDRVSNVHTQIHGDITSFVFLDKLCRITREFQRSLRWQSCSHRYKFVTQCLWRSIRCKASSTWSVLSLFSRVLIQPLYLGAAFTRNLFISLPSHTSLIYFKYYGKFRTDVKWWKIFLSHKRLQFFLLN